MFSARRSFVRAGGSERRAVDPSRTSNPVSRWTVLAFIREGGTHNDLENSHAPRVAREAIIRRSETSVVCVHCSDIGQGPDIESVFKIWEASSTIRLVSGWYSDHTYG